MKVVASSRTLQGTGASRRMRNSGVTPGIVYGGGAEPQMIQLEHNALFHALRKEAFHSSILDLEVDGTSSKVLLRDFQMHPFKQLVLHIDFQRIDANNAIHVKVPLHFVGAESCAAVKLGGAMISHVTTELDVQCLPGNLPEFIEVDLSKLEVGHAIHAKDLVLGAGVTLTHHVEVDNPVIASAKAPAGGAAAETTAA